MIISNYLGSGVANAVTGEKLADMFGCTPRDISRAVEAEREKGVPICASSNSANPGYFLPESAAELALYLHSLNRRLRNIRKTYIALQDTLNEMTGQENVWE